MNPRGHQLFIEKHGRTITYTHAGVDYTIKAKVPGDLTPKDEKGLTGGLAQDARYMIVAALTLQAAGMLTTPLPGDRVTCDGIVHAVKSVDPAYDGEDLYCYRMLMRG